MEKDNKKETKEYEPNFHIIPDVNNFVKEPIIIGFSYDEKEPCDYEVIKTNIIDNKFEIKIAPTKLINLSNPSSKQIDFTNDIVIPSEFAILIISGGKLIKDYTIQPSIERCISAVLELMRFYFYDYEMLIILRSVQLCSILYEHFCTPDNTIPEISQILFEALTFSFTQLVRYRFFNELISKYGEIISKYYKNYTYKPKARKSFYGDKITNTKYFVYLLWREIEKRRRFSTPNAQTKKIIEILFQNKKRFAKPLNRRSISSYIIQFRKGKTPKNDLRLNASYGDIVREILSNLQTKN